MTVSPTTVFAVVVIVWTPGDRAIGGFVPEIGPYAVPLFGGATFQLPSSCTGAVPVTVGSEVMSFAKSDSMIRRLTLLYSRSPYRTGSAVFSLTGGRRTSAVFAPPIVMSARFSALA